MFLARDGTSFKDAGSRVIQAEISKQNIISLKALHSRGVSHKDIVLRNMCSLLINFERSVGLGPEPKKGKEKRAPGEISRNLKRKQEVGEDSVQKDRGLDTACLEVILKNIFDEPRHTGKHRVRLFDDELWQAEIETGHLARA